MNDKLEVSVKIWLPQCPKCQAYNPRHYGKRWNARGESIRYYECSDPDCGHKFLGRIMNPDDDYQ